MRYFGKPNLNVHYLDNDGVEAYDTYMPADTRYIGRRNKY